MNVPTDGVAVACGNTLKHRWAPKRSHLGRWAEQLSLLIAQRTTQQHLTNGGNWANKWRQIDTKGEEERAVKKREKGEIQIVLPAKWQVTRQRRSALKKVSIQLSEDSRARNGSHVY